jgi:hypothetical protein
MAGICLITATGTSSGSSLWLEPKIFMSHCATRKRRPKFFGVQKRKAATQTQTQTIMSAAAGPRELRTGLEQPRFSSPQLLPPELAEEVMKFAVPQPGTIEYDCGKPNCV